MEAVQVGGLLHAFGAHVAQGQLAQWALAIFVGTYVMIILERFFHRTIAALLGASALMVIGIVTPEQAWSSINFNTIFLLFGMMNIVTVMSSSGLFGLIAEWAVKKTGGQPARILWTFSLLTALFSAFLDNVTTVLFMAPVMIHITSRLKLPPIPFLIAIVLASNTGGTATLIGDPPNIIISSIANKTFNEFLVEVAPYAILAFLIGLVVMHLMMAKKGYLKPQVTGEELALFLEGESQTEVDWPLLYRSVGVFLVTVVLFILGRELNLEPGTIALLMASVLMLITNLSAAWILERVEWTTLIFFMGLFIVVGALEHTGVFTQVAIWLRGLIGTDVNKGILLVGFFSAIISGFVDNIPFTISMSYVLKSMEQTLGPRMDTLWWALSLGACLGGNLTLIGASANIVTADIAERSGHKISFFRFMAFGTPIAAITVTLAVVLFYVEHAVFGGH